MVSRPSIVAVLVGALASMGASFRTANFVVEAPTAQAAQQVGEYAEHYRREKAMQWLGQEMPQWGRPCPLRVTVSMSGSSGATTFAFDRGRILDMNMHIEGSYDRLLASVLPHEVTHTVFAYHFRQAVPRWADEGGSVLSEDDTERNRHDHLVRQILNTPGRAIPLRRLFAMTNYPPDVMVLYAEGYSVANFLVGKSNRSTFLQFVAQGMHGDWDGAARAYYQFNSVEELEKGWFQFLREGRQQQPPALLASRTAEEAPATQNVVVRQTVPPAQPLMDNPRPVVRGQASEEDEAPYPYPRNNVPINQNYEARPQPAPPVGSSPFPPRQNGWPTQRQAVHVPPPPPVRLTSPDADGNPPVQLMSPIATPR